MKTKAAPGYLDIWYNLFFTCTFWLCAMASCQVVVFPASAPTSSVSQIVSATKIPRSILTNSAASTLQHMHFPTYHRLPSHITHLGHTCCWCTLPGHVCLACTRLAYSGITTAGYYSGVSSREPHPWHLACCMPCDCLGLPTLQSPIYAACHTPGLHSLTYSRVHWQAMMPAYHSTCTP